MVEKFFIGLIIALCGAGIRSLMREFAKVLNASIKNEYVRIESKNIKYFWPSILASIVLFYEVWINLPYNVLHIVDLLFFSLAIGIIMINFAIVFWIGNQELNTNKIVSAYRALLKRHEELNELLDKNNQELSISNRLVSENYHELSKLVNENSDLFSDETKERIRLLGKRLESLSKSSPDETHH